MTKEELQRIKGYRLLLKAMDGDLSVLSPYGQKDFKQLLKKWLKEKDE